MLGFEISRVLLGQLWIFASRGFDLWGLWGIFISRVFCFGEKMCEMGMICCFDICILRLFGDMEASLKERLGNLEWLNCLLVRVGFCCVF